MKTRLIITFNEDRMFVGVNFGVKLVDFHYKKQYVYWHSGKLKIERFKKYEY